MVRNQRDEPTVTINVTDWTNDSALDCDTDDADLGDTLGTAIKGLQDAGIISGSTTPKA